MNDHTLVLSSMIKKIDRELFPQTGNGECHVVSTPYLHAESKYALFVTHQQEGRQEFMLRVPSATDISTDAPLYVVASSDLNEGIRDFLDGKSAAMVLWQTALGAVWDRVQYSRKMTLSNLDPDGFFEKWGRCFFRFADYSYLLSVVGADSTVLETSKLTLNKLNSSRTEVVKSSMSPRNIGNLADKMFDFERQEIVVVASILDLADSREKSFEFFKECKIFSDERFR